MIYEKLCGINLFWILEVELGKFEKVATAVEAIKKGKIDLKYICTIIISLLLPLLTHVISVLLPLLQTMQVLHLNYSLVLFPSVKEVTLSENSSISYGCFILFVTPFFIP